MKRLLLSTILLAIAGTAYADIQAPPASEYTATRKLGRALSNVIFAVDEIPNTMLRWNEREGNNAAFTVGIVDGVARTFNRMGYGFYELVTFWAPTYKCTYRPPYQGSCGRSGLTEFNTWSGFTEFPAELGMDTQYEYARLRD